MMHDMDTRDARPDTRALSLIASGTLGPRPRSCSARVVESVSEHSDVSAGAIRQERVGQPTSVTGWAATDASQPARQAPAAVQVTVVLRPLEGSPARHGKGCDARRLDHCRTSNGYASARKAIRPTGRGPMHASTSYRVVVALGTCNGTTIGASCTFASAYGRCGLHPAGFRRQSAAR